MPLPKRTPEQRQLDLAAAAAVRQARKNIKRDLKDGRIDLEHAIALPVMQRVRVRDLLLALPGVGEVAANEAMAKLSIADGRRVQGLGANQLAGLLEWWDGRRERGRHE